MTEGGSVRTEKFWNLREFTDNQGGFYKATNEDVKLEDTRVGWNSEVLAQEFY